LYNKWLKYIKNKIGSPPEHQPGPPQG